MHFGTIVHKPYWMVEPICSVKWFDTLLILRPILDFIHRHHIHSSKKLLWRFIYTFFGVADCPFKPRAVQLHAVYFNVYAFLAFLFLLFFSVADAIHTNRMVWPVLRLHSRFRCNAYPNFISHDHTSMHLAHTLNALAITPTALIESYPKCIASGVAGFRTAISGENCSIISNIVASRIFPLKMAKKICGKLDFFIYFKRYQFLLSRKKSNIFFNSLAYLNITIQLEFIHWKPI